MTENPNIESVVHVNSVVWITSLRAGEQGVTRRILEDLEPLLEANNILFIKFEPQNAVQLLAFLDHIANLARGGLQPIIHFDTHGGAETGIHIVASGENCSWPEITEKLRAINVATVNNLCVISLACFSFHLIKQIHVTTQAPFYILAAPQDEVSAAFVEDSVVRFYRCVFERSELIGAFREILIEKLLLLHCEEMLFTSMTRYVRAFCMGKGAQQRVEEHVTEARRLGYLTSASDISGFRKRLKAELRPKQALVDRFVETFLLGRPVSFDIDAVKKAAKAMPDPYADGKRKRPTVADSIKGMTLPTLK
ncbi:hypothetical protein GR220_03510 [Rhizobium leguminosarum]|uniref:hypothetical protein n=1 Tax=Rhizobium TaxID=379 RepID=UPI0010308BAF|nr:MULTISPECIES: hypothetical protein [Rhizobium]NEI11061.1 hypothetical protein [Rhizobium ruizarguesonis]TAY05784.1 hypothetical protein ELH91_30615 [Rhizobium leguminosarum]